MFTLISILQIHDLNNLVAFPRAAEALADSRRPQPLASDEAQPEDKAWG